MISPTKYHGGKRYLARSIIELMPPHMHYVEPFAGGLSVLLAKSPEGVSEVVNDLDGNVANFWAVLRDPSLYQSFRLRCHCTTFDEWAFNEASEALGDASTPHDSAYWAWAFFVVARQSLAGRGDTFAPLSRSRTRRAMNEQASAWISAVDGLDAVYERMRRVATLNRPALDVIRQNDGLATLFYCDPPYHPATRASADVYRCEMTHDDHVALLAALNRCVGAVLLSGYRCDLYDAELASWTRHDFPIANHAAGGKSKRSMIESVWVKGATL